MTRRSNPVLSFCQQQLQFLGKCAEIDQCVNSQANYAAFNKAHLEFSLERRSPMKQWFLFLGFKALLSSLWSFPPFVSMPSDPYSVFDVFFYQEGHTLLCTYASLAKILLSLKYHFLRSPQTQILSGPCL